MNNVVLFRSRDDIFDRSRVDSLATGTCTIVRLRSPRRPTLAAVWHANAAGRLECRWSNDGSPSLEDTGSHCSQSDQAA